MMKRREVAIWADQETLDALGAQRLKNGWDEDEMLKAIGAAVLWGWRRNGGQDDSATLTIRPVGDTTFEFDCIHHLGPSASERSSTALAMGGILRPATGKWELHS